MTRLPAHDLTRLFPSFAVFLLFILLLAGCDLYIADVGQNLIEEVNFQSAASTGGENYGWNFMEGTACFTNPACDRTGLTLPLPITG